MTSDDLVNQLGKDVSLKDTQQQRQEKSFQIVLVDIEKAANDNVIQCVKKSLDEKDLKFVAISYRWGELHETLIDTKVGYTASITSFALNDFYKLCRMMTLELDFQYIKYVWVDAICVDQRPSKRKATIYQMSNIYDRATYILAVPDLHLTYLIRASLKNNETIEGSNRYCRDIYHLIHGNIDKLNALEEQFLNDSNVPKDPPALRELLLRFTEHFAESFMHYRRHDDLYCPVQTLDHICETTQTNRHHHWRTWRKGSQKKTVEKLHECHEPICPLKMFLNAGTTTASENEKLQFSTSQWKAKIIQRSNSIRQSMELLADLIVDWSSRVWVISEYNIAKKKNSLKYWFTQLSPPLAFPDGEEFTFFTFVFDEPPFSSWTKSLYTNQAGSITTRSKTSSPVCIQFHSTIIQQLNEQTFLEMVLTSKASKNEDRLYSILPLSEYRDKKTEMPHWKIHNMTSVKLKLYEIMNIKDKLTLLFWSTNKDALKNDLLPTFATSTLPLDFQIGRLMHIMSHFSSNFDLFDTSTMMLHHYHDDDNDDDEDEDDEGDTNRYYLRLTPIEYYVVSHDSDPATRVHMLTDSIPLCKRLGIDDASMERLDIVLIPAFRSYILQSSDIEPYYQPHFFILVGCFAKNKWILPPSSHTYSYPKLEDDSLQLHMNDGEEKNKPVVVFDIY